MELPLETPVLVGIGIALALVIGGGAAFFLRKRAPASEEEEVAPPTPAPRSTFFAGFSRSREALAARLQALMGDKSKEWDGNQLEEALISADVGVRAAGAIVEGVRRRLPKGGELDRLRGALRQELLERLGPPVRMNPAPPSGPLVILVVGVNGSGKTTTIGKLAARYRGEGKKVLLAAGDTFRAGAIEQLKVWADRAQVGVVAHKEGSDPAAVIFDALEAGKARGMDVVICDTAGRLQAQATLMDQLSKVVRVMKKSIAAAPHEVLLVLDGTSGQNAMSQARIFKQVVGVTGVALTKLDGTAKGGVVVAVRDELQLDVKLVGLGERVEDLRDFEPESFVDALLG